MKIDTNAIVTAAEANQNFSRVAKLAEKKGRVIVVKKNRPKLTQQKKKKVHESALR